MKVEIEADKAWEESRSADKALKQALLEMEINLCGGNDET